MTRFHQLYITMTLVGFHASLLPAQVAGAPARPFTTWTDTLPYRRGLVVWVRNVSPDTLTTVRLTVHRCLNIGVGCTSTALAAPLPPQDSAPMATIRPRLWDDRYVFALNWEWESRDQESELADSPQAPASGQLLDTVTALPLGATIRATILRRGPGWHRATVQQTTDGCFVAILEDPDDPRGVGAHLRAIGTVELARESPVGFPLWLPVNLPAIKAAQPAACARETGLSGG